MKSFPSDLHHNDPMYSPATSAAPASAARGEEATTLVVIDDDRMFHEFEVQVRCDLGRFARSGKPFTFANLFLKARRLLAHVVPLPARKL
jgi:hypothetical protein